MSDHTFTDYNGKIASAWAIVENDPPYKIPAYASSIYFANDHLLLEYRSGNLLELDAIASGQFFTYKPIHELYEQLTVNLAQQEGDWAVGVAYCKIDPNFRIVEEQPEMVGYFANNGANIVVHDRNHAVLKWNGKKVYAPVKHLHKTLHLVRARIEYKEVCLIDPTKKLNPVTVCAIAQEGNRRTYLQVTGDVAPQQYDINSKIRILNIRKLREFQVKSM